MPDQSVTVSAAREVGSMQVITPVQTAEERISAAIAQLPAMDRAALLKVWTKTFPTPPPPKLRKELMVPILAYRLQEAQFGGLSHSARMRLETLIAKNRGAPVRLRATQKPAETTSKLIRSWRGEIHEVLVTDSGFIYRGEHFRKLSPIAKRITGTQWSGPAFFGTREKRA
jgi:hypothetical protein